MTRSNKIHPNGETPHSERTESEMEELREEEKNIVTESVEETISRLMLKKGLMRRPRLGLHEAIQRGQVEVVKQICSERCGQVSIDECSGEGAPTAWDETPLMVACQAYYLPNPVQLRIIDSLLENGARPHITDNKGRSPLALSILSSPDSIAPAMYNPSPWYKWGDSVLCRCRENINCWEEATAMSSWQSALCKGGIMLHTIRLAKTNTVVKDVLPMELTRNVPADRNKLSLGTTVLIKDSNGVWHAGVICATSRKGGFDVRKTGPENPLRTHGLRELVVRGLGRDDIRIPPQHPHPFRPATEGQLYPGCNVHVLLPNWPAFRKGMIQGRNTIQGGFNVLLDENVDKETGGLVTGASHKWLHFLKGVSENGKRKQSELPENDDKKQTKEPILSTKYIDMVMPESNNRASGRSCLLVGVHVEWIRVRIEGPVAYSNTPVIVKKLCAERREDISGKFKTREEFGDDAKWNKQEGTQRVPLQYTITTASRLTGSQVVAIAARYSNIAALVALREVHEIRSKDCLIDWHESHQSCDLVTDPEVALFFLSHGVDFCLAKTVRSCNYSKRDQWREVIRLIAQKKHGDQYAWAVTSPSEHGLNAVGWACALGRLDVLKLLLRFPHGVLSVQQSYKAGMHPLFLAVKSKQIAPLRLQLVEMLLEHVQPDHTHALAAAVEEGSQPIIRLLLGSLEVTVTVVLAAAVVTAACPGLKFSSVSASSPASVPADSPRVVKRPDDVNPSETMRYVMPHDLTMNFEIIKLLCPEGKIEMLPVKIVSRAVKHPAGGYQHTGWLSLLERVTSDWQAWNDTGETALSIAVMHEDHVIVDLLLEDGRCNPNVRTSSGEYPVGLACKHNKGSLVLETILKSNQEVYIGGTLALPRVCKRMDNNMLKALLEYSYSGSTSILNLEEAEGATPFEFLLNRDPIQDKATRTNLQNMVRILVAKGAHAQPELIVKHAGENDGWLETLKDVMRLSDGTYARPIPTPGKQSALMCAILKGNYEMVKFLVECKADLLQTDADGRSVLVMAIEAPLENVKYRRDETRQRVLEELLVAAPLSLIRANGVLAAAARRNSLQMIELLNRKTNRDWCEEDEMDVDAATNTRRSPVELASDQAVQRLLIDMNFRPNLGNLAKRGKFNLMMHALQKCDAQKGSQSFKTWLEQRSTRTEEEATKDHVGRSALAWVLSRRFADILTNVPEGGVAAFRYVDKDMLTKWGIPDHPSSWMLGTAYAGDRQGLVMWEPQASKRLPKLQRIPTELHRLVLKNAKLQQHKKKNKGLQVLVNISNVTKSKTALPVYRKMVLEDCERDKESNMRCIVTSEPVRTSAGMECSFVAPLKVSLSDCVLYSKIADMENETVALRLLSYTPIEENNLRDENGTGVLELAAREGDHNLVSFILSRPEIRQFVSPERNLNESSFGYCATAHPCAAALCAAAASRKYKVCELLLGRNKNTDGKPYATPMDRKDGRSVGQWAASKCIVTLLHDTLGPDHKVERDVQLFDLCHYARRGWLEVVVSLSQSSFNVDINQTDSHGRTPLIQAAWGSHVELVAVLLDQGDAYVDVFDMSGRSVLGAAALTSSPDTEAAAIEIATTVLEHKRLRYLSGNDSPNVTNFLQRSKALSLALTVPAPSSKIVELFLQAGSLANETHMGKSAIRHLGNVASEDNSQDRQAKVASTLIEQLLTWKIKVIDKKSHLLNRVGSVVEHNELSKRYRVKFEDASTGEKTTTFEWVHVDETKCLHQGEAACGKMLHSDFEHVVSMGWPEQVGLMIDLGAIEGYHGRALPYICSDTLKSTLLQCLRVLRPVWEKEDLLPPVPNARNSLDLVETPCVPAEWYVLRHLLRGLNTAHGDSSQGPTLQQAVNELLEEEKETLRLLPLWLYREAIADCLGDDLTFFSDLFVWHQHRLKVSLCESWGQSLINNTQDLEATQASRKSDFAVFKALYTKGKEMQSAGGTLELAVEYGWVQAVEWLVKEQGVKPNVTNTANKPIRTVALEIDKRTHEVTGQILKAFFGSRKSVCGSRYTQFMRDRDDYNVIYSTSYSLNDAVITTCSTNSLMRALVGVAMVLFSSGANADPEDLQRLSQVMRLDQCFDVALQGTPVPGASLLHISAACDNASSLTWLLNNQAYSDTLGTGVMEDTSGKTARHYTLSHECHKILARRERAQQVASNYMPPMEHIHLVIALKIQKVYDFDLANLIRGIINDEVKEDTIGVSTVLHALHSLDLGGFFVQPEGTDDAYIVVSGSERRQLLTCAQVPYLRSSIGERELLSKEKHTITQHIVNSFTWPVLDLSKQTAIGYIVDAVKKNEGSVSRDDFTWIVDSEWFHNGKEVRYPNSLRIACSYSVQYSGVYEILGTETRWGMRTTGGTTYTLLVNNGKWEVTQTLGDKTVAVMRHPVPFTPGKIPDGSSEWTILSRTLETTEQVTVSIADDSNPYCKWEILDYCNSVVHALVKDRDSMAMATRLASIIASLPDGTPQEVDLSTTIYRELEGTYKRQPQSDFMSWMWVRKADKDRAEYQLTTTFTRSDRSGGSEIKSLWTLRPSDQSSLRRLTMKSNDIAPWHHIGKWINTAAKETPLDDEKPPLSFTWVNGMSQERSAEVLAVKTKAMWALRQLCLAAGVPQDELPFRNAGRLEPDVDAIYRPPCYDHSGSIPPGQKWLDLLETEEKIVQVFGIHNDFESDQIIKRWQPNTKSIGWTAFLKPWLWEPFSSVYDFWFEYPEMASERKYDPCTRTICNRKTFLNLQPMSKHSSTQWEALKRMHVCDRNVPLFFEKAREFYLKPNEPVTSHDIELEEGQEVMVSSQIGEWGEISLAVEEWWLPINDDNGKPMLVPKTGEGDEGSRSILRAVRDVPYYTEASKKRCPGRIKSDVEVLENGAEIEVIRLDLDGKWAKVHHHSNAVYFKTYWMPLMSQNKQHNTLKAFYLSQVTSLESYMGSKIAFYFTFVAFYLSYLLLLLMTGVLFTLVQIFLGWYESEKVVIWNAVLVIIWAAVFRQRWVRKATELAYLWNVRNVEQWEPPMAEYLKRNAHLEKRPHSVTNQHEPYIPRWKSWWWGFVSIVVTAVMGTAVVVGMYANVILRDTFAKKDTLLKLAFGVENAISITMMDAVFAVIADRLNKQENHRTRSALQGSSIIKSFIFRFINGFSGLIITVFRTPTEVCDCHIDCDPACRNTGPFTVCPSQNDLFECIAQSRQSDIVVQLTTMLVIQSVLSIIFEKVIPRTMLLSRRKIKENRENSEENVFPKTLGCLATTAIDHASFSIVKDTLSDSYSSYSIELSETGPYKDLCKYSTRYGGVWKEKGSDITYKAIHDEHRDILLFYPISDGLEGNEPIAVSTVDGEARLNDELNMSTAPSPKKSRASVVPSKNSDISMYAWFPIASNDKNWVKIRPSPGNYARLAVETPNKTISLERTLEIRTGALSSEPTPLTLSQEDRREANIPPDATHFMWVYGLTQKLLVNPPSDPLATEPKLLVNVLHEYEPKTRALLHAVVFGAFVYLDRFGKKEEEKKIQTRKDIRT